MDMASAPKLDGWMTFSEVAVRLNVTRQAVFNMVARDELTDICSVGSPKSIYLARVTAVEELAKLRSTAAEEKESRKANHTQPDQAEPPPATAEPESPVEVPRQRDYVLVDPTLR